MAADGSVVIESRMDVSKADKDLAKLKTKIENLEKSISETETKRSPLAAQMAEYSAKLEEARKNLAYLKEEQAAINTAMQPGAAPEDYIAAYSNKPEVEANLKIQQAEVDDLQKKFDSVASKVEIYDQKLKAARGDLEAMKESAGGIEKQILSSNTAIGKTASKASSMSAALERAKEGASTFATRLKGVVTSALIFTVISQALAKFRDWMSKVIKTNDEASAAMARLRGSLLTLVQPLVNVLIPAFTTFANVLTRVISMVSQIVSALFGTTAEQSAEAAKGLYEETNALEGTAGAMKTAGEAAEKAQKSLAGFDEINQLSGDSSNTSSGGETAGASSGGTAPDFSGPINDGLTGIVELFTGAALLALGAILTFSGAHIFLGIGLMVLGALAIWDAVSTNWTEIQTMLQGPLGILVAVISSALLVIGAILVFSGTNIPLGLGLMIAGAIGIASAAAANWQTIVTALQGPIGIITTIISTALLVLGSIITFSGGNLPLGIGLMAAGAVGLAPVVGVNWDSIVSALQGPIGVITTLVSAALIVIGAVLCFSGVGIPLGIALMAAGAIGLVTVTAVNWNAIVDKVSEIFESIKKVVSAAWNWLDSITNGALTDIVNAIQNIFGGIIDFVAGVFTGDWERAWDGIVSIFQGVWDAIWGVVRFVVNLIIDGINMLWSGIYTVVSAIVNSIGGIAGALGSLFGQDWHFSMPANPPLIPKLAQGAVIPPNREFLAVLGDQSNGRNLEAPESLLREIIREESGDEEIISLLRDILAATKAGRKMYVNRKVLAETARDGINAMTIEAGRSVLLY